MAESSLDDVAVRHLIDLGYTDPIETASREAEGRSQRESGLRGAAEAHCAGQNSRAIELASALIAQDSDWISPHRMLAAIYFNAGDFPNAQSELEWLSHHGVEHPRLAFMSGAIALEQRRLRESLEYLEYAAYVEPEIAGVFTVLGRALLRLNRTAEAAESFARALRANPTDPVALDGLAAVHLRNNEFEKAAELALSALDQNMRLFTAHYHLGIALARTGHPNEAITAFETAARLDRTKSAPFHWLALIAAEQLNDPVRAISYREQGKQVIRDRRKLA